ncbi:MAG: hypothetical protein LJE96_09095 [Deltaproteobacteria bacterium]|nr:hypothetical protein [Deltaproteobacteria bacterium]
MLSRLPEKALHLEKLREGKFNVPDFIYVPAEDFRDENFEKLQTFLKHHQESFKVIARSAHPHEAAFKPGTFDSLETYADVAGIQYARKRIIKMGKTVAVTMPMGSPRCAIPSGPYTGIGTETNR